MIVKVKAWNDLFPVILTTYHDGYIAEDLNATTINMVKMFYPYFWLKAVGFYKNPPNNWVADPAIIEFQPVQQSSSGLFFCVVMTSLISLMVGFAFGKASTKLQQPLGVDYPIVNAGGLEFSRRNSGYQSVPENAI